MKWWILVVMLLVFAWFGQAGGPVQMPAEDFVVGEVILDLRDGLSIADARGAAAAVGGEVSPLAFVPAHAALFKVRVPGSRARTLAAAAELSRQPGVAHAEPNWLRHALYQPNDPLFKHQWHMRLVRAPETWDLTTGEGVTVAVLDTGIAYGEDHAKPSVLRDLKGAKMVAPVNTLDDSTDANDRAGHGSHVSGTIAQTTNNKEGVVGVAYGVRLMPVKVLSDQGWGTLESVVKGIYYAADKGAQVINMSLGSRQGSPVEEDACTYAFKKGVFVACAAGNGGTEYVEYPAACKDAVAIAAVRYDKSRSFYSSYGAKVALSAPGGDKRVDQDGDGMPDGVYQNTVKPGGRTDHYDNYQGTSMATPHAAAAAALVMSVGVKDPAKVLKILQDTASKVGGNPRGMGAGVIDCYAAVKKAKALESAPRPGARVLDVLFALLAASGLLSLAVRLIRPRLAPIR
jgi:serine protease